MADSKKAEKKTFKEDRTEARAKAREEIAAYYAKQRDRDNGAFKAN